MNALTERQRADVEQWVPLAVKIARTLTRGQRADRDDAEGDALLQMCQSVRTFDAGRGVALQTHLGGAARLAVVKSYQRQAAAGFSGLTGRKTAAEVFADRPRAVGIKAAHDKEGPPLREPAEFSSLVKLALSCLTPNERRAVLGRIVEERAYEAMARGTNPKAVRGAVERGVKKLRAVLAGV
jgi:DNA-directed RNA polymerase specialized sigma24 family protein